jgi:hypothetical protein
MLGDHVHHEDAKDTKFSPSSFLPRVARGRMKVGARLRCPQPSLIETPAGK